MISRTRISPAGRIIFTVLFWGIVTELTIVMLGLATGRSIPALLHIGLLYVGSYVPMLFGIARRELLSRRGQ